MEDRLKKEKVSIGISDAQSRRLLAEATEIHNTHQTELEELRQEHEKFNLRVADFFKHEEVVTKREQELEGASATLSAKAKELEDQSSELKVHRSEIE